MSTKRAVGAAVRAAARTSACRYVVGACCFLYVVLLMACNQQIGAGLRKRYMAHEAVGGQHVPMGMEVFWMHANVPPYEPSTGRFRFDKAGCSTTKLCIDVGAHEAAVSCGRGSVIAFEPQIGFWSQLRNQGNCVFAVPAAVSPDDGMIDMHISRNGHSSSLLNMDDSAIDGTLGALHDTDGSAADWSEAVKERDVHKVFAVRLDEVIKRSGMPRVEYLKVDAQGFDLQVVKSAGEFVRVINRLKIEAKAEGAPGMYAGQPNPSEIIAYMESMGFKYDKEEQSCCLDKKVEVDLYFHNEDMHAHVHPSCPRGSECAVVV